ncbi:hypothetical protein B0H11DRAFT_1928669 [Mycena galericulata]|nr:hypothetical protein B0H11DRAFT_1928669 [Mycena galericulata]
MPDFARFPNSPTLRDLMTVDFARKFELRFARLRDGPNSRNSSRRFNFVRDFTQKAIFSCVMCAGLNFVHLDTHRSEARSLHPRSDCTTALLRRLSVESTQVVGQGCGNFQRLPWDWRGLDEGGVRMLLCAANEQPIARLVVGPLTMGRNQSRPIPSNTLGAYPTDEFTCAGVSSIQVDKYLKSRHPAVHAQDTHALVAGLD